MILATSLAFIRHGTNKFISRIGLFAAIALAGGSVAGSFFVPTKALGVFLAAIGCFAAGWMFSAFFAEAIGLAKEEGSSEKELEEELKRTKEAKASAENRAAKLESENVRLKNQRIEINEFSPVLELGLEQAEMNIKDWDTQWMDDFDSEGYFESLYHASRSQYVGFLEMSFKATYGVKLQKLRVREDPESIKVSGIEPERLGFKDMPKTTWHLRQKQTYQLKTVSETNGESMPDANHDTGFKGLDKYYEIDREQPFEGSFDLNETMPYCERQQQRLLDRLNKGVDAQFRDVNDYIRKLAEGFIRLLLAPVNKPVVFVETPLAEVETDPDWLALEDYAKKYNDKLLEAPAP